MAGQALIRQGQRRRKAVLRFIRSYAAKNSGRTPTIAEIAEKVGLRSPNATRNHLLGLQDEGYVRLIPRKPNGVVLIDPAPDDWTAKRQMECPECGTMMVVA